MAVFLDLVFIHLVAQATYPAPAFRAVQAAAGRVWQGSTQAAGPVALELAQAAGLELGALERLTPSVVLQGQET